MDPQNPPSSSHGQGGQRPQAPIYDTSHGGHYGKSPNIIETANGEFSPTDSLANANQLLR